MTHLADNGYDISLLQVQLVFGNSRVVEHSPTAFFYCGGIKHVFSDHKFTAIVIKLISKFCQAGLVGDNYYYYYSLFR